MGQKIFQGFMAFLGSILLILFIALFGRMVYREYSGANDRWYDDVCSCGCDSIQPSSCLSLSTVFSDPADVVVAQSELLDEVKYIDQFRDMSTETLSNVTAMLFRQRAEITIRDIIDEYNDNHQIYDNLRPQAIETMLDKEPAPLGSPTTTIVVNDSSNSNPPNDGK